MSKKNKSAHKPTGLAKGTNNKPAQSLRGAKPRFVSSLAELGAFEEGVMEIATFTEQLSLRVHQRVKEELVVSKQVELHTETIQEEVRRTLVEIEQSENYESGRATSLQTSEKIINQNTTEGQRYRL